MSDELRDEPSIERVADLYSWAYAWRWRDGDDDTDLSALRKRNRAEFERALEVEIARRVAEAKAEVERLEIWKQVATILLEKVKVNGKPALEIFDTGLAVQQEVSETEKGEANG